jgi:hypothetical protein
MGTASSKYLKEIRVPGDHIDWSFDENRDR